MIRVLLADDEAMVRAGVRAILGTDDAIEVVAEAADGVAAVEAVRRHRPDVAVLDIRMPRMDGLAVGAGLSNAEIAARLYLVEGTVKAYVSAVLLRLAVKNRVQAAIVAYEAGLVTS